MFRRPYQPHPDTMSHVQSVSPHKTMRFEQICLTWSVLSHKSCDLILWFPGWNAPSNRAVVSGSTINMQIIHGMVHLCRRPREGKNINCAEVVVVHSAVCCSLHVAAEGSIARWLEQPLRSVCHRPYCWLGGNLRCEAVRVVTCVLTVQ